jgi:hypothetical protein
MFYYSLKTISMSKHLHFRSRTFRRCYLLLLALAVSLVGYAQKEVEKVKTYLKANANQHHLSNSDIDEMGISSAYLSPTTGWYHVYFVQKHQSIEVYNGVLNTTLVKDNVANVGNNFVPDIASKVPAGITIIPLTPLDAISKAATSLKLPGNAANTQEVSINRLPNGLIEKAVYTNADLSNDNIHVKLYWLPYDTLINKQRLSKVDLVWNVQIETKDHQNIWSVQVNALSGDIIDTKDMVIHCDFGIPELNHEHNHGIEISHEPTDQAREKIHILQPVVANSYGVFDYPKESPNHGAMTSVVNPYIRFLPAGKGPGVTNGWHDDGVAAPYTITRGNNVYAREDRDNNNAGGYSPTSATLDFNYTYTHNTGTSNVNLDAAITNLFYWNNVIHDVLYRYGFDEPSGNFQKTNLTATGLGNDFVNADAQDGSGSNNANFNTPVDGGSPRMQMYLWNQGGTPAYQPDSDFDNGVITHEYGHGWSIRLTGGPSVNNCLQNAEQGGEGWSDFLGLMMTTDWGLLTPTLASANLSRSVGTYSLAMPTNGVGIRKYPYSYDIAGVNPLITYKQMSNLTYSIPHATGSIWSTVLWDMAWEIIMLDNKIVKNIYDADSLVGNVAALKLVHEGLKLQKCSPSFIDARNAILKADTLLFNARYSCVIWNAFARRGMGKLASTGASSNDRIVTEDFTPHTDRPLTSPKFHTICSGNIFSYTATAAVGTTFSWKRPVITGISNAVANGNSAVINETLINTTSNPITVTYYFQTSPTSGCTVVQAVKVTVEPSPVPTVGTYNICKNASVPGGQGLAVVNVKSDIVRGTLTSSSPTYQRGINDRNSTVYTGAPSANYYYAAYTFVAPASAPFYIETIDGTLVGESSPYDTYLSLYQNSFNPASPATNFLRGDDDSGIPLYGSRIGHNVVAGTTYIVVVTTYSTLRVGGFAIQATSPVFPNIVNWFTTNSGGSAIATGDIFNPVGVAGSGVPNTATAGTTLFYAESSGFTGCRTKTTFIINPTSVGGNVAGSTTVCAPINAGTLTLSGHTGSVVRWESSIDNFVSNIVPIVNTTTSLGFSNLTQTTKYRAVVKSGNCAEVNSAIATITVTTATAPTPTGNSRCGTGTVLLTATGCAGGTINWYAGVSGGTSLATGTSFTTPSISSTTPYYVSCTISGCTSTRVSVTATIKPVPSAPTPTGNSRCGTGTVLLTATGCAGGTINWYAGVSGGTSLATGTSFTTPSISNTTSYYVSCTVNGCPSNRVAVTATVTNASAPTPTGNSRCSTGTVLLTASGCAGGTINWYAGVSGGSSLATGTSFTTPSISSTTTYYVGCTISGCTSNRVAVAATIKPIPSAPIPTAGIRCGPGTVVLTATGCAGGTINWYTVATGGTSVGTGGTYTTPSISTNTTYYVSCTVNGCPSTRASVIATVNVNLTFSGSQAAGNYRVSNSITSTADVASGVNYYAKNYILMNPGFQAGGTEVFLAKIQDCP